MMQGKIHYCVLVRVVPFTSTDCCCVCLQQPGLWQTGCAPNVSALFTPSKSLPLLPSLSLRLCCSGPAGDKKAMSEFRRKQQDERKRLDKAKTKWHSEQVRGEARQGAAAKWHSEQLILLGAPALGAVQAQQVCTRGSVECACGCCEHLL